MKTKKISLTEFRSLIKNIIKEEQYRTNDILNKNSNIEESGHSFKVVKDFLKWLKKHHNWKEEMIKKGLVIIPPTEEGKTPYHIHKSDKAIYDIMRHVAKHYDVSKKVVEDAFNNDTKIDKSKKI